MRAASWHLASRSFGTHLLGSVVFVVCITLVSLGEAQRGAYTAARRCALVGDHACVVRTLSEPHTPREFRLLIGSLRALGDHSEAQHRMRQYIEMFPEDRWTPRYRLLLTE